MIHGPIPEPAFQVRAQSSRHGENTPYQISPATGYAYSVYVIYLTWPQKEKLGVNLRPKAAENSSRDKIGLSGAETLTKSSHGIQTLSCGG